MANDKFKLESTLFKFLQGQCVLTDYHSKKLLQAVQGHKITDLDLTGSFCNLNGFTSIF